MIRIMILEIIKGDTRTWENEMAEGKSIWP